MATSNTNPGLKTGNKAAQQPGPTTTTDAKTGTTTTTPAKAKRVAKPRPTKEQRQIAMYANVAAIVQAQAKRLVHIDNPKAGVEPYVVAAAITTNILAGLRNAASQKPLTGGAMQAACDAWVASSLVEEFDLPMGGTSFRRIEAPATTLADLGDVDSHAGAGRTNGAGAPYDATKDGVQTAAVAAEKGAAA